MAGLIGPPTIDPAQRELESIPQGRMRNCKILCVLVWGSFVAQTPRLANCQISIVGQNEVLKATEKEIIEIDESQEFLSDVASVSFADDGRFVVSSSAVAQVLLFRPDGTLLRKLGTWG